MLRIASVALAMILASSAMAQDVPGFPQVPTLPPPILPKIEIPPIPKMDEMPRQPSSRQPLPNFQDRAIRCQHQGGAAGLSPADVASYTRACANL